MEDRLLMFTRRNKIIIVQHNKIITEQRNSIIIALHNKIIKARQYHKGQRRPLGCAA